MMTGPIAYDPMPAPTLADPSDGVDAFADVASVGAVNFAKVNTYLGGRGNRATFTQTSLAAGTGGLSGTGDVRLVNWPRCTFTVPAGCLGVMITLRVMLFAVDSQSSLVGAYAVLSGAGLRVPVEPRLLEVLCTGAFLNGARSMVIRGPDLIAGQAVNIDPWGGWNAAGPNTHIDYGSLQVLIFKGP